MGIVCAVLAVLVVFIVLAVFVILVVLAVLVIFIVVVVVVASACVLSAESGGIGVLAKERLPGKAVFSNLQA